MFRNIRRFIRFLSFLSFVGLVCDGCSVSEFDSVEALHAYLFSPENDLIQVEEINGYEVRVTYRPTDLLVHQALEGKHYDSSAVNALRKKYSDYYYFIVRLSRNSRAALHMLEGGASRYSDVVQVLSFRMGDYVTLTTSANDTIRVGDYMLNRTFGLSQSTDLLFVFNRDQTNGREWVQFNLNEFGLGVGNLRFRFLRADLEAVPDLDFGKVLWNP